MAIDQELEELLLLWEEARERGESIAVEALCGNCPERVEEVRLRLRVLQAVDDRLELTAPNKPGQATFQVKAASRFHSIRPHAKGGLGEVYFARDEILGRDVALKLIRPPEDETRRRRFLREAAITAGLAHPGVVPIFALGETEDGRVCHAMRFIEGETLQDAINRLHESHLDAATFASREFRGLISRLVTVCQTVAYAHSRGVIHRDLKPANIMLGPFQETLVVDWGLAKRIGETREGAGDSVDTEESALDAESSEDDRLTQAGSAFGTPAYMSPEQAAGRSDEIGTATDIHGLGATLYHILTGRSAFRGRSRARVIEQVLRGDFPRPSALRPGVPRALEAVCLKTMAQRASDRYPGALEMSADLERWLADEPVLVWREPWSKRLGRLLRRNQPIVAGFSALVATALIALAVSAALLSRERDKTKEALGEATSNYKLARARLNDLQTALGLNASSRSSPSEATLWFAQAAGADATDETRSRIARIQMGSWSRMTPLPVSVIDLTIPGGPGRLAPNPVNRLAFDGSGRFLLAVDSSGRCAVRDIVEDRPIALPGEGRKVVAALWVGQGKRALAIADAKGIDVYSLPRADLVSRIPAEGIVDLDVSRDGDLIAIGAADTRVWRFSSCSFVSGGIRTEGLISRVVLSEDGAKLALAATDGRLGIHDVTKSAAVSLGSSRRSRAGSAPLLFAPDGLSLIVAAGGNQIVKLNSRTGAVEARITASGKVESLFMHPAGNAIAAGTSRGVSLFELNMSRSIAKVGSTPAEAACFSPDGVTLMVPIADHMFAPFHFPDGRRGMWDLPLQREASRQEISPDGGYCAAAQTDGLVRVFRLPSAAAKDWSIGIPQVSARLAMGLDGRFVMPIGGPGGTAPSATRVNDLETQATGGLIKLSGILRGGAFSPDNEWAVTLELDPARPQGSPGTARFWDWRTAKPRGASVSLPSEPVSALFNRDGTRLFILCERGELLTLDDKFSVIRRRPGDEGIRPEPVGGNERLVLSPDGKRLLIWGTGPTAVIDWETSAEFVLPVSADVRLADASLSPDGRIVAEAGSDGLVRFRDRTTGKDVVPPLAHPDTVLRIRFSKDGKLLLSGCRDGAVRVWNWRERALVGSPITHRGQVNDLYFLNDDTWILSKGTDDMIRLSDVATGAPLLPTWMRVGIAESNLMLDPKVRWAAAISALENRIHVIDLSNRVDQNAFHAEPGEVLPIAELISGRRVARDTVLTDLTSLEWLERWRKHRDQIRGRIKAIAASVPPQQ